MQYKVMVLLSSYNGEKYIREQLDSILTQQGVEVTLLVRDDGSRDATPRILREYAERCKNVIVLPEENVGCVSSFRKLLTEAYNYIDRVDYFAFADQDDVWLPEKLKSGADRKSTRLNSSHKTESRMPSSA